MRLFLLVAGVAALAADFAPAVPGNMRNSEADALLLRDGRLLLAWTEFLGDGKSDWTGARLSARISSDRGATWGERFTLQENIGAMNVMEPDLLRLKSGKVLFLFARKNSPADCAPMVRISKDDAKTFSPPVPMTITPSPSYTGFNHDRAIQLRGGRVLMPLFFTTDYRVDPHIRSRIYYSDDEGASWKPSETILELPQSKAGAQEPGVIELNDGRVMVWVRTDLGRIYRAYSRDKGKTFSELQPIAGVESPRSPQSMKRHPRTGDLVLVWNNSPKERTPLSTAVSRDEGLTWTHRKVLDDTPGETFAYTSLEWLRDGVFLSYYAAGPAGISLRVKTLPLSWFYQ
jgi:predicted neuraminidase